MATGINTTPAIPAGNVFALPTTRGSLDRIAANLPALIERLPSKALLPHARVGVRLATMRMRQPGAELDAHHAVFGAMLALCRVLDEAGYPWDAIHQRGDAPGHGDVA